MAFMGIDKYSKEIDVSPHTIRKRPEAYFMFRVGRAWKADEESINNFKLSQRGGNNAIRLAIAEKKEESQCRYIEEVKRTGSTYQRQMAAELDSLLKPKRKIRPNNYTTS